jgi:hypothetical protein
MAYWIIDSIRDRDGVVEATGTREGPYPTYEDAWTRVLQLRRESGYYVGRIVEED